MSLGERLKQLRKKKKLIQKDIAEMLGIDNTTVSKWESDTYEPDIDNLNKLAEIYGVSVDYLIGNKKSDGAVAEGESEFLKRVREIAAERGMELTDPNFLDLFDAFLHIRDRLTETNKK